MAEEREVVYRVKVVGDPANAGVFDSILKQHDSVLRQLQQRESALAAAERSRRDSPISPRSQRNSEEAALEQSRRNAERALAGAEAAYDRALSKARLANRAIGTQMSEAAEGVHRVARGMALLGFTSDENVEKLLKNLAVVQGIADSVLGTVKIYNSLTQAVDAYHASVKAAGVAESAISTARKATTNYYVDSLITNGGASAASAQAMQNRAYGMGSGVASGAAAGAGGLASGGAAVGGAVAAIGAFVAALGSAALAITVIRDQINQAGEDSVSGTIASSQASLLTNAQSLTGGWAGTLFKATNPLGLIPGAYNPFGEANRIFDEAGRTAAGNATTTAMNKRLDIERRNRMGRDIDAYARNEYVVAGGESLFSRLGDEYSAISQMGASPEARIEILRRQQKLSFNMRDYHAKNLGSADASERGMAESGYLKAMEDAKRIANEIRQVEIDGSQKKLEAARESLSIAKEELGLVSQRYHGAKEQAEAGMIRLANASPEDRMRFLQVQKKADMGMDLNRHDREFLNRFGGERANAQARLSALAEAERIPGVKDAFAAEFAAANRFDRMRDEIQGEVDVLVKDERELKVKIEMSDEQIKKAVAQIAEEFPKAAEVMERRIQEGVLNALEATKRKMNLERLNRAAIN